MIPALFFLLIGAGTILAFTNWRMALYLMILSGLLQDPVRKILPGAPGWMVLAFTPIWLAICSNLLLKWQNPWRHLFHIYPRLQHSFQAFALSLSLAFFVLLVNYGLGVWKVGAIGMVGYVFPMIAIVVGFYFLRSTADLIRFIRFYSILTASLLIGGLLEKWQIFPEWRAIGTEALDMVWIRHVPGYIVELISGFYRSPDMLGWHAGLLVMFSLLMAMYSKSLPGRIFWLLLAVWGSTILLISGRNKMIFMPPIFVTTAVLAYMYKGNVSRSLTFIITAGVSVGLFFMLNQQLELDREYFDYVGLGTETATTRVKTHGFEAVVETFRQSGFFGEGMGSASTGARYGGGKIRTWQESGSSKLMVELGVVGFVAVAYFLYVIFLSLKGCLDFLPLSKYDSMLFIGLLGILAANAASFSVSHQAFGDPFLVTLTGMLIGMTLSAPRWVLAETGK